MQLLKFDIMSIMQVPLAVVKVSSKMELLGSDQVDEKVTDN